MLQGRLVCLRATCCVRSDLATFCVRSAGRHDHSSGRRHAVQHVSRAPGTVLSDAGACASCVCVYALGAERGGLHTKPPPAPRVFSKKRLSRCRHTSPPKRPYGAQLQPSQASTTSSCPSSIRTPTRCRSPSPSTARGTRIQPRGHVARGYNHGPRGTRIQPSFISGLIADSCPTHDIRWE